MNMNIEGRNEAPRPNERELASRAHFGTDKARPNHVMQLTINTSDVLCGRGKLPFNHAGNRRFRDLVGGAVHQYNEAASRLDKATVVNSVVEEIQGSGGRFLRQDEEDGTWHILNYAQCREKVGHAIRDAAASFEARKRRKLQREEAQRDVADAISDDSKKENLAKPSSKSTSNQSDGLATRYDLKPAFLAATGNQEAQKLNNYENQSLLKTPSELLQGLQQRDLMGFLEDNKAEQRKAEMCKAANIWRPNVASGRTSRSSIDSGDDDEQFLAYIDQVLGPLPQR